MREWEETTEGSSTESSNYSFVDLLGNELLKNTKLETIPTHELTGKMIAIYFSAHWCPPCRPFTPKLIQFYEGIKKNGKDFEIVFVSSDRDSFSFLKYFQEMPWLAVPFTDKNRKECLYRTFDVSGMPTLVIFDEHGGVITIEGRNEVLNDPKGDAFIEKHKGIPSIASPLGCAQDELSLDGISLKTAPVYSLVDLLGDEVLKNTELETSFVDDLKGKVIGIYFSAYWCAPCKSFSQKLKQFYDEAKQSGKGFEIIFVSSDRDIDSFNKCFKTMPWMAVPFTDRKRKDWLSNLFEVDGIPSLVILDQDGNVVTLDGRNELMTPEKFETFNIWNFPEIEKTDSEDIQRQNQFITGKQKQEVEGKLQEKPQKNHAEKPNQNEDQSISKSQKEPKEESPLQLTEQERQNQDHNDIKNPEKEQLGKSRFVEVFGETLLENTNLDTISVDHLANKVVAIYFSAHWCSPCKSFTAKLAHYYQSVNQSGKEFEIVFVSSDQDLQSFQAYFREMPWLAVPFTDRNLKEQLSNKFSICGIPSLVILDKNATIITLDGRSEVMGDPEGENFALKD